MNIDFVKRAYDHSFPLDPIVRSLMDTDFYKLLMMQFIWEHYPNEVVSFKLTNRTKSVRLAEIINVDELRQQLDYVRTLRFQHNELIWLRGNTFYGQENIFKNGFIETLRAFRPPDYNIAVGDNGQFNLTFEGKWWEVTLWEIYALRITNELRYRSVMRTMSRSQLDIMYARAKVRLYAKLERLATVSNLNFSDFGTRRAHSFLWQEYCVQAAREVLGSKMTGTSNVYLAMKHGLEAKGTNAHELPMTLAALARRRSNGKSLEEQKETLREAQYTVLKQWQNQYNGNLLVFLPDTFGTTQFLKGAPQWVSYWKGARPDSKEPILGGEELIAFWKANGIVSEKIASDKLILFADGLDVRVPGHDVDGPDIIDIHDHFDGRVLLGFGMGTMLTNDFTDCAPAEFAEMMKPISIVAKVDTVNRTQSAVKLSDNFTKATGNAAEIDFYRDTFGSEGMKDAPVLV